MSMRSERRRWAALLLGLATACSSSSKKEPPPPPPVDPWPAAVAKAQALLATMTLDQKMALLEGQARPSDDPHLSAGYIPAVEATGLTVPAQYLCDSPNGVGNGNTGVTRFPTGIAVAATFDVDLAQAYGDAMGAEWAGKGCLYGLGPGMNVIRLPYGGRSAEYYSEDPFLSGKIGAAEVQGIQGQHVIATIKHYVGNDQETSRTFADVVVSERALREVDLLPFELSIREGGAAAVMCSYNRLAGVYVCQNPHALTGVLRDDWGFQGVVMSDWTATHDTVGSVTAGMDMDMPGSGFGPFFAYYTPARLQAALDAGEITTDQIDAMALHVLSALYRVGSFDEFPRTPAEDVSTDAHKQLAQRLSEAGTVLLKNAGDALPLDGGQSGLRIAVIGGAADAFAQSGMSGSGTVNASETVVTALAGITARAAGTVTYARGSLGTGTMALLSAAPGTGNATVKTAPGGSLDGFTVEYADAQGEPIAALAGGVTPEVSHGSAIFFGIYQYAHPWPATPVTVGGTTGTLTSGAIRGWSATFTGYLTVPASGTYELNLTGSGGAGLYVDGNLVGAIDTGWFEQSSTFLVPLTAGEHQLRVREDTAGWTWPNGLFGYNAPAISLGWNPGGNEIDEAVAAAAAADVAIVVVSDWETEGSDHPATLPGSQDELVERVAAVAKKTVVVLNTGSGLVLPWADRVDAILENWYGGQRTGSAVAAVLFGDVNPSGRAVVTFPVSTEQWYAQQRSQFPGTVLPGDTFPTVRYDEGVFVGYRWFDQTQQDPLFPFGHGLSYTQFAYGDLDVSASKDDASNVNVSLTVRNVGQRAGSEVAQLYVGFPGWAGEPPRQLKGFGKVTLEPGASARVKFQLDQRAFSYWDDATDGWVVPSGAFQIMVGSSSRDIRVSRTYTVTGG